MTEKEKKYLNTIPINKKMDWQKYNYPFPHFCLESEKHLEIVGQHKFAKITIRHYILLRVNLLEGIEIRYEFKLP